MKVLSFIIPSYNCEQYLDKCLTSFVDEKILDKLEIIIVNDGSTDNTAEVAEVFCNRYPESFRIISQENRGHGGALNTGCAAATGKYLKIIDADDWAETDNLAEFVRHLEDCESDVVLTHHYTRDISTDNIQRWMSYPSEFGKTYSLQDIMHQWKDFSRSFTFHGICYNTAFYKKTGYVLSEKVFYEDHEFSTFPACFADSVTPFDIFIYNYRIGNAFQSVSDVNKLMRLEDAEVVLKRFVNETVRFKDEVITEFVCVKAKILLISYLTTSLLVDRDRKQGRERAKAVMAGFKCDMPRVYSLALKQYHIFRLLNLFGIRKDVLDRLLKSKVYLRLKGTHDFN